MHNPAVKLIPTILLRHMLQPRITFLSRITFLFRITHLLITMLPLKPQFMHRFRLIFIPLLLCILPLTPFLSLTCPFILQDLPLLLRIYLRLFFQIILKILPNHAIMLRFLDMNIKDFRR